MQVKDITADEIVDVLLSMGDDAQRDILMRFFKTGKGEYGEGDKFMGVKVPNVRLVIKEAKLKVTQDEIARLLMSEWHEARLAGFFLLVEEMKAAIPKGREEATAHAERREEIARFYLRYAHRANNWDLVDMSCPKILGKWLLYPGADGRLPDRAVLYRLAESSNLWEQRIAMVTCWMLIRADQYDDALRLAEILMPHPHDLIHKAVGWMLREVGKRDICVLEDYLDTHGREMHRTTLRYAIEKMAPDRRQHYLTQTRTKS